MGRIRIFCSDMRLATLLLSKFQFRDGYDVVIVNDHEELKELDKMFGGLGIGVCSLPSLSNLVKELEVMALRQTPIDLPDPDQLLIKKHKVPVEPWVPGRGRRIPVRIHTRRGAHFHKG